MCAPLRHLFSRTFKFASSAGAIAAVIALAGTALTQEAPKKDKDEVFTLNRAVPIPGNALVSFDISWFDADPSLNNYYLADRSNKSVDVIHSGGSTVAHQFMPTSPSAPSGFVGVDPRGNDFSGPDGVVTVDHKELWVGDGKSRVWVLDPNNGSAKTLPGGVPNPIPTSTNNDHRADELCYDSADHLILVANNADVPPFASIISTQTYTVVPGGKIVFDGNNGIPAADGIEQCQWSPRTGKFYISLPQLTGQDPGVGAVAVIDPKTKKVALFPIPVDDCAAPQGMAIGPDKQILLGCNQPSPNNGHSNTVIINENTGAITGRLPDLGGNDEVWFNPGDGHYFLAEGQLLPTERLGVVDSAGKKPDQFVVTANNPGGTSRRAHSVAADPGPNEVYVPIPANTTGFSSPLCSDPTKGCVAIFSTGPKDDHPRLVRERDPDDKQE